MTHQNQSDQRLVDELRLRIAELEKAAQQKEAEATRLLQMAPLGIHECDTDGRITFVNQCQEQITGYTAAELIGTYIWDRIEPGPQKESSPDYLKHLVLEQPSPTPSLARNIRKNGELYEIRIDWNYRRNPQGQVTGFICIIADVTEQKRVEAALQASEERFHRVFEEGPLGIALLGLDARIQHCNRRLCEMLGYSEEEVIALGLAGISNQEDLEKDSQFGSRLRHGEIPNYTIDKRYVRRDGTEIWGQLTVSLMHDAQGNPTAIIGMVEDISERKRAEAGLRNSERTLRALIDASLESILLLNPDGTVLIANETVARRFGRTVDELIGHDIYSFFPAEVATRRTNRVAEAARTGKPIRFEDRRFERDLETVVCPILDELGEVATVGILGMDRTEQKRAEAALRESEERYRKLTESTTDLIYIADRNGDILYANSSAAAAMRSDVSSIVGKRQTDLFSPEMAQRHTASIAKVFETGEVFSADGVYHFDSEEIWLNTHLMPLRDEMGQITSVMGVSRNITARKRAEAALQKAHDELERRVEERTGELVKANQDLVLFRKLAEASGQAFSIVSLSGQITYVNQTMCRLLGEEKPEDVAGKYLSAYHSEEYAHMRQEELVPLILREGHWKGETVITLRGSSHSFLQDSRLVRDEHDNPAYVATVMADITERKRAQELLQREHRTLKHLLQSSDHERQTIAYEIHDGLAQQLAGAIMQFQTFTHRKETKPKEAQKAYDAGMTMLQQGHSEARRLISGVRPPILDEEGIVAAVAHLVHEQNRLNGPKIEYRSRVDFDRLAPTVENAIYRIIQEGLANARQHSKSEKVRVSLVQRYDRVQIGIRDWGIGFDTRSSRESCFGLEGIRQRVRLLGGKCSVRSKTGKGARITVELPVVARE